MSIVSMEKLSEIHNISRVLIKKTIANFPDFPYIAATSMGPGNGYKFDTEKVEKWLLTNDWARGNTQYRPDIHPRLEREAEEKREKQIAAGLDPDDYVPASIQKYRDAAKAKNSKSDVQTQLLQLELDKKRGDLVRRDDVINEFAPMISTLAKGLEIMPNLIGKRHGLSDAVIRDIRDHLDQLREALVRSSKIGMLSDDFVASVDEDE